MEEGKKKKTLRVPSPDLQELEKRFFTEFKEAKEFREMVLEPEWAIAYDTAFSTTFPVDGGSAPIRGGSTMETFELLSHQVAEAANVESMPSSEMSVRYSFKYVRYLHSQASQNPPATIYVPTSTDLESQDGAEAATRLAEYGERDLDVYEVQDGRSLDTIVFGTGISKVWHNPWAGDFQFDEDASTITLAGEIQAKNVGPLSLFRDPNASVEDKVKYTFESHIFTLEEAIFRWPDDAEVLRKNKGKFLGKGTELIDSHQSWEKNLVLVLERYTRGLPENGMAGQHCWGVIDGEKFHILDGEVCVSPVPEANLPYQWHTDIDVPGRLEGKSFLDYTSRLQDLLDRVDTHIFQSLQQHSSIKLIAYRDSGVNTDNPVSTDGMETIWVDGMGHAPPTYLKPAQLMPDINVFRQRLVEAMEALAGLNEQMFGQVKRQLSGYAMQNAVNSANTTRTRFFVKYKRATQRFYDLYIALVQKYWSGDDMIDAVGKENAYSLTAFSVADLKGKYAFASEYGMSFSKDPETKQEQILQLAPYLEKAKVDPKEIVGRLGISDLRGLVDTGAQAKKRQMEVFKKMEAWWKKKGEAIVLPVYKNESHADMLTACNEYRMSARYQSLRSELQKAIDTHIDMRIKMAAMVQAGNAPGEGGKPIFPKDLESTPPPPPAQGAPGQAPQSGGVGGPPPGAPSMGGLPPELAAMMQGAGSPGGAPA